MQYRSMPKSSDKLSVLGYGCMRLPTFVGGAASSLIDKEKAVHQIRLAIDNGVNYLDTAYPYHMGASESFLGEHILKDGYREKVFVATKLPCMIISKASAMEEIFQKQLAKLQIDTIDYYLLHSLDGSSWEKMKDLGVIDFMDRIRKEKKVRHMGFSFHGRKEDFMKIVDEYNWDFTQIQYNILDEHFQAGIEGLDYAHSKGMGVIIMEPLRGGSLVGKIPDEVQKIYDIAEIRRSPADWAFRWIYNHPAVTMILSGMNRDEHIIENIRIADESLPEGMTDDDISIVAGVRDRYNQLLQVGCTGCAYCMPCPAGIDIPAAFKNLNNFHMFSKMESRFYHLSYLGVQTADGKAHWTSSCINCGQCESKCPQNIPVRNVFKQVQKDLEGPGVRMLASVGRTLLPRKTVNPQKSG
ncbi:aldo/keto reductase [Oceanispirochaeta sp.]|jgi:predicted aldo/keto reductase-like oxidoreductase|uniref:aldo/keto reductase n=1 Tax=Oceanispirochaeta sp. TaxID=2035350 RepID=UPI0026236A3A|nr:aldo/keto reductase [Oceanispirochaeta sp.]MDA3956921.1 aldo/keto reductase [Oceanispirochaeta sp.]